LLSIAILNHFFGKAWTEEHVALGGPSGLLRQDDVDRIKSEQQSFRLVDLAEILFNLQNVEGFDDCIEQMKNGNIEGTYAELDLGRMLYVSDVNFCFVKPSGKKGDDFDIEITLSDGMHVCADAKCKIEATVFSENTVLNSLEQARTQFPSDRPSVVFVKVPPQWFEQPSLQITNRLDEAAHKFFRTTQRVVSVKFYVSKILWRDGMVTHLQSFKEIDNPTNRFAPARNWAMFAEADERIDLATGELSDVPGKWRRLLTLIED